MILWILLVLSLRMEREEGLILFLVLPSRMGRKEQVPFSTLARQGERNAVGNSSRMGRVQTLTSHS